MAECPQCPACHRQFICGVVSDSATVCWCQALPRLDLRAVPSATGEATQCYCPACLQTLLELQRKLTPNTL
ncbi:cysteine-rich CWC family protein [Glaciimonas sp. GG7]